MPGFALSVASCTFMVDTNGIAGRDDTVHDESAADTGTEEAGATTSPMGPDADTPGAIDASDGAVGDAGADARYRAAVLADSPTSYFRFEEDKRDSCVDTVATTPCTYSSTGVTFGVAGIASSRAVRLASGAAGSISLSPPETDLARSFTIELWLLLDPVSAQPSTTIFEYEVFGPRNGMSGFLFSAGAQFRTETWAAGTILSYTLASVALVASTWHHVVVGFDVATANEFVFFDGVAGVSGKPSPGVRPTTSSPFVLSAWNGVVDELAFYDRALPQTRVQAHYALR